MKDTLNMRKIIITGIVCFAGVILFILISTVRSQRDLDRRIERCRMIHIGLANYNDTSGRFVHSFAVDKEGNPTVSWRGVIAVYIQSRSPWFHSDKAWNDPVNLNILTDRSLGGQGRVYSPFCFSDRDVKTVFDETTNILGFSDEGSAFNNTTPGKLEEYPNDLILFIEVNDTKIHWAQPFDLHAWSWQKKDTEVVLFLGTDGRGCLITFADGKVWYVRNTVPFSHIIKLSTIEGAKKEDRELLLGEWLIKIR